MNIIRQTFASEYQSGSSTIETLLPDGLDPSRRYPVLFLLPAMPGPETGFGDSLDEIRRLDLHNRYGLICVRPVYNAMPWYADHPDDAGRRQESHLLKAVLPFVAKTYPMADASARLLAGFSKSGWGAFSLLLRNPALFVKAAAWDAPLMQGVPDRWNMPELFPTQADFEAYRFSALVEVFPKPAVLENRLILLGYGNFRDHVEGAHALLDSRGILHAFDNESQRPHRWDSGWLPEAVRLLCGGDKTA